MESQNGAVSVDPQGGQPVSQQFGSFRPALGVERDAAAADAASDPFSVLEASVRRLVARSAEAERKAEDLRGQLRERDQTVAELRGRIEQLDLAREEARDRLDQIIGEVAELQRVDEAAS